MPQACSRAECTVGETGICVLNNDPATCSQRIGSRSTTPGKTPDGLAPPSLVVPAERPRFSHSYALSPDDLAHYTTKRYHHLIGILGAPNAGKTAILVSLYLLLANNRLEGYEFADSYSMMAFDEISRGARRWNEGNLPEQLTSHTELPDDRTPGFLHLRIRRSVDGRLFDLILPDLPGEWSDTFIDHDRADRLAFLKGADCIWVTINGTELSQPKMRQQVLHRAHLLFQRLSKLLPPPMPPVFVIISHHDLGDPEVRSIASIEAEAKRYGLLVKAINVASFSENNDVLPGSGIGELVTLCLARSSSVDERAFWPSPLAQNATRFVLRFRG